MIVTSVERTKPNSNYISPSKQLVEDKCKKLGVKEGYSYELLRDVSNYLSYPDEEKDKAFTDPSTWNIETALERKYYDKEQDFINAREADIANQYHYHNKVVDFVKNLDCSRIKGDTPLEKAISIAAATANKGKSPSCKSGQEEALSMINGAKAGAAAQLTIDSIERVEKLKPESFTAKALEMDDKDLLGGVKLNKLSQEHLALLDKIAVFEAKGKIKASKKIVYTENDFSKKKRHLNISKFSDVPRASPSDLLSPTFEYKMLTKQLVVEKGVDVEESKQCLILCVDDSSSMSSYDKVAWLKALFINRCEQVVAGNAELYICTFEKELDPDWFVVRNEQEAMNIWEKFRGYFKLQRGGTCMQTALESVIEIIKTGKVPTKKGDVEISSNRPQICLINDGEDYIDEAFIPTIETHGFILHGSHKLMERFCKFSGGTYTEFRS